MPLVIPGHRGNIIMPNMGNLIPTCLPPITHIRTTRKVILGHPSHDGPGQAPQGHPHPEVFDPAVRQGAWAKYREKELGHKGWKEEVDPCLAYGLEAAPSVKDRSISCFARGELPHFAGINTFIKSHYLEDVTKVSPFDAAVIGVPFDIGTTYRSGTRFGPQGIRRISALYGTYNYELGVDVRESL